MPITGQLLPGVRQLPTGYVVANSLRTNKSDQPRGEVTQGTPTNVDKYTFSVWVKRADLGASNSKIFSVSSGSTYGEEKLEFNTDAIVWRHTQASDGSTVWQRVTNRVFRDSSAWYNIIVAYDSTQGTAADRCKMYINGVEETSFSSSSNPSSGLDSYTNTSGRAFKFFTYHENSNTTQDPTAYFAELVYIDGQQLDQTSFGEFDSDSPTIWKPIDVSGLTFGNNGFYLDFQDSSALGNDVSGNNNDMTLTNISAINQSTDTCTNNFATWNPLWSQSNGNIGDVTFTEGNLKSDAYTDYRTFPATIGFNSGKWYWEIKRYEDDGTADMHTGVMSELATPANTATWIGSQANGWVFASDAGSTYTGGTETNTGYSSAGSAGDIVQVAFDADNGKIYFGVNGTWQGSGNPATGTNPAYTGLNTSLFYFPCSSCGSDVQGNFGSPSYSISSGNTDANGYGNFEYAVPSGFYSINTKNLAEFG